MRYCIRKFFMKIFATSCLLVSALIGHAQFQYRLDDQVPVTHGAKQLRSAWSGGLNAAQYNVMDIDSDGVDDLVIYDRTALKIFTFLRKDGEYKYAPDFELMFPNEIADWVLLRDFDGDGRKDLFTGNLFGIRVFKNVSQDEGLAWEPVLFGSGAVQSEVLLTKGLSGMINLKLQFDDLPSITDADGDGDLDIFAMDFSGTGRVEYHRNYAVERHGDPGMLEFELITKAWGGFAECDCGVFAFEMDNCGLSGGRVKHQGGKALLALDANGDGNLDMLLSEAECDILNFLPNEGTTGNPAFLSSEPFPSLPAQFPMFPTPYYEDIDGDGVRDLIITPNVFSRTDAGIDFRESNWFYKNRGTNAAPDFEFERKDFLQGEMIDVGDNATPTLVDFDGDGDLDILIGTNQFPASIYVYENTGTTSTPEFTLSDSDYLNLSVSGYSNLKIQVVDVNLDKKPDLVFTATLGATTWLYYILNESTTGLNFGQASVHEVSFTFFSTENLHLADVNGDGLPDILRGRNTGALEYWRNSGDMTFVLAESEFLGIGTNPLSINPVVFTADLNGDGRTDLILSDHTGVLRIINDFRNNGAASNALTNIVLNERTGELYAPGLGGRLWPAVGKLFGSARPDIIAGTTTGGLRLLRADGTAANAHIVNIYPNPLNRNTQSLTLELDQPAVIEVFAATGQLVSHLKDFPAGTHQVDMQHLSAGLYVLRVSIGNKTLARRLVVR